MPRFVVVTITPCLGLDLADLDFMSLCMFSTEMACGENIGQQVRQVMSRMGTVSDDFLNRMFKCLSVREGACNNFLCCLD